MCTMLMVNERADSPLATLMTVNQDAPHDLLTTVLVRRKLRGTESKIT